MIAKGEAFSRRLEMLSDDTMLMISEFDQISKESHLRALDIAAETDYKTEEEVVKQLLLLQKNYQNNRAKFRQ